MNKTGLMAKISIKYVLPTSIWKYFWRISRYFAFLGEFRGSATARNIRSPVQLTICQDLTNQHLPLSRVTFLEKLSFSQVVHEGSHMNR